MNLFSWLAQAPRAVLYAYAHAEKRLSAHVMKPCLPDFLGIGAQKAGTSWLYENLRHHPQIYLPDQKELHYFDKHFQESLRSYTSYFEPGCGKVKGEITPAYSVLSVNRIRTIRTIMPDVRLIFLMRNPIERAWSQAVMNLVRLPGKSVEQVEPIEFLAHIKAERSVKRGDYLTILDNWFGVFPHEQIYVGFFDDISSCPQKLLLDVFAHIGVSSAVDWATFPYRQVVNKNPDIAMPTQCRDFLNEMYRLDIEALYERFGGPVSSWRCLPV